MSNLTTAPASVRLSICLSHDELQALLKLSQSEKRTVRDQAAYLVVTMLIQRGLLSDPTFQIQNNQEGAKQL